MFRLRGGLQLMHQRVDLHDELSDGLCTLAAGEGQLEILKWLRENDFPWDEVTYKRATSGGHLAVLQWAHANGCPWDEETYSGAAYDGKLEILQWARANSAPWDGTTCVEAAYSGHLEVLQWARANSCPWDEQTCGHAALAGHFEVLQWARAHGCPWDERTCEGAAKGGHLEVLQRTRTAARGTKGHARTHRRTGTSSCYLGLRRTSHPNSEKKTLVYGTYSAKRAGGKSGAEQCEKEIEEIPFPKKKKAKTRNPKASRHLDSLPTDALTDRVSEAVEPSVSVFWKLFRPAPWVLLLTECPVRCFEVPGNSPGFSKFCSSAKGKTPTARFREFPHRLANFFLETRREKRRSADLTRPLLVPHSPPANDGRYHHLRPFRGPGARRDPPHARRRSRRRRARRFHLPGDFRRAQDDVRCFRAGGPQASADRRRPQVRGYVSRRPAIPPEFQSLARVTTETRRL